MTARVQVDQTTTITIILTPAEAAQILGDFDQTREPSLPGKALYGALVTARGQAKASPPGARCEARFLPGPNEVRYRCDLDQDHEGQHHSGIADWW